MVIKRKIYNKPMPKWRSSKYMLKTLNTKANQCNRLFSSGFLMISTMFKKGNVKINNKVGNQMTSIDSPQRVMV